MQYKSLAALLFASMAVAAPAEVESRQDSDSDDYGLGIPNSILAVVATAVPSSFWAEATNSAALLSQVEQGIASNSWPSWYSSLPDSVKEYVTTAVAGEYPSFFSSVSAEATSSGASGSTTATATGTTTTDASSSGATTESTTVLTGSSTSATATGSETASSSGSPSSTTSGAPESTSSDDAAAATGVSLGLAGAAGILGLALAL